MTFSQNLNSNPISSMSLLREEISFLTSMRFYIHIPTLSKPIIKKYDYPLGEKPLNSITEFSFSEIPKSDNVLIQYLGVVRSLLSPHSPSYSYGDLRLNLEEEIHFIDLHSHFDHSLKKKIAFGGQYITEATNDIDRKGPTGKVLTYFHPKNQEPKIPLHEEEIFNGWFHFSLPFTQKEKAKDNSHISFSYVLKESKRPLFDSLNTESTILNTSSSSLNSLSWSQSPPFILPFEVVRKPQKQNQSHQNNQIQEQVEEDIENLNLQLRSFYRFETFYLLGYFNPFLTFNSQILDKKICLLSSSHTTLNESLFESLMRNRCENEKVEKVDQIVSLAQFHSLHGYPSRTFGFHGPFTIKDKRDFFQPFVKTRIIEGEPDKIRLTWDYLPGVKESSSKTTLPLPKNSTHTPSIDSSLEERIFGLSIYAKNILEKTETVYPSFFHLTDQITDQKILNPYLPDKSIEVSCLHLENMGWSFVADEEEKTYYDFDNKSQLSFKEEEHRKKAQSWKFVLCPYERRGEEKLYYSSLARKLCLAGEECEQFQLRNSFGQKSWRPEESSVVIEDEDISFSNALIGGAFGRVVQVEKKEENKPKASHLLLHIPSKEGEFHKGDEILIHVSFSNSLKACGEFRYQPIPAGLWALATVQEETEEGLLIENGTFVDQLKNSNLNRPFASSSLCYVQALKVPHFHRLHIKNGSLKAKPFKPELGGGILALRVSEELHLENAKIDASFSGPSLTVEESPLREKAAEASPSEDTASQPVEDLGFKDLLWTSSLLKSPPQLFFGGELKGQTMSFHSSASSPISPTSFIPSSSSASDTISLESSHSQASEPSEDPPLSSDDPSSPPQEARRGGGIIYLTAKKVLISRILESIEAKGEGEGKGGSLYLTTQFVTPKMREREIRREKEPNSSPSSTETPLTDSEEGDLELEDHSIEARSYVEVDIHHQDENSPLSSPFLFLNIEGGGGKLYLLSCNKKNILPYTGDVKISHEGGINEELLLTQALNQSFLESQEGEISLHDSLSSETPEDRSFHFEPLFCP